MSGSQTQAGFDAIIVAGGRGLRAGLNIPKQFAPYKGKPVLVHSLEAFVAAGARRILAVVPDPADRLARALVAPFPGVELIQGGASRRESVLAGLEALEADPPSIVLIHDAARPQLPSAVIDRLLAAVERSDAAIPVLPVVDSLARADGDIMAAPAQRDALRRMQTPQGFRFETILAAHRSWNPAQEAGDDAQVVIATGHNIMMVDGDESLKKLTFSEDFAVAAIPVRIGTGFDVHRLGDGEELWLCGIRLDHDRGLVGHSDADVGLHAITDAVLGAVAAGDIGQHFSPSDQRWKGAASDRFLIHARELADERGYRIGNIDLTIICEAPRIGPHREAMIARIAAILEIDPAQVSVKATTTERLGFAGREEGIAAQAVATLVSKEF